MGLERNNPYSIKKSFINTHFLKISTVYASFSDSKRLLAHNMKLQNMDSSPTSQRFVPYIALEKPKPIYN